MRVYPLLHVCGVCVHVGMSMCMMLGDKIMSVQLISVKGLGLSVYCTDYWC